MTWLLEPSLADAAAYLRAQLPDLPNQRRSLVAVGRCGVDYEGRAQSKLAPGDRVVLIKADGTLLIHNPSGLKPVNWQPPGCTFTARMDGSILFLEARRAKPAETVQIRFEALEILGVAELMEGAPLELVGTEFDIRDTLMAKPELVEAGFVPWAKERITERGPMDLYGEDAKGRRVIVEVKRVAAGLAEATQLWRYVEKERTKRGVEVRGILVAPAISPRAQGLLREHGLEWRVLGVESLKARSVPLRARADASLLEFGSAPERRKR